MNALIFFIQIFVVCGAVFLAFSRGKEALYVIVSLLAVFANIFVVKQIDLFSLTVTCSEAYIIGSIGAVNLLLEFFGKKEAKKAIWIALGSMIFLAICAEIQLRFRPSDVDRTQEAFIRIFSMTKRVVLASFIAYFSSLMVDVFVFRLLQKAWDGHKLFLRMAIAFIAAEAVDTAVFSIVGLYGYVAKIFDVMLMSFTVKCLAALIFSFVLSYIKKIKMTRDLK